NGQPQRSLRFRRFAFGCKLMRAAFYRDFNPVKMPFGIENDAAAPRSAQNARDALHTLFGFLAQGLGDLSLPGGKLHVHSHPPCDFSALHHEPSKIVGTAGCGLVGPCSIRSFHRPGCRLSFRLFRVGSTVYANFGLNAASSLWLSALTFKPGTLEACLHISQRSSVAPTVKPAPTAASSTRSPFFNLPCSMAVSMASGMVPADVLPYFSIFTTTRSGFRPSRSAVEVMMRRLAWWGMKH